jgi:hypothetical protein
MANSSQGTKTTIVLALRPPAAPIALSKSKLFGAPLGPSVGLSGDQTLYGYELFNAFGGGALDKTPVSLIESPLFVGSHAAIVGLVELVSNRGVRVYQERVKRRSKQLGSDFERKPNPNLVPVIITPTIKRDLHSGSQLLEKHKRFRIALERWCSSLKRDETVDSVLDLCSCLEAHFSVGDELRLRLEEAQTCHIATWSASFKLSAACS